MFYKHWNKIALALTGFFWASCDSDSTSANNTEEPTSSETSGTKSSSSTEQPSSSEDFGKIVPLYGIEYEKIVSSSSMEEIMPAYGVPDRIACIEDPAGKKNDGSTVLMCDDGVTCQEKVSERWVPEYNCVKDICPDYGVVAITEKTYTCDDGNTYNEAEFRMRYEKWESPEVLPDDTSYTEVQVLYGTPESFKNMENQEN